MTVRWRWAAAVCLLAVFGARAAPAAPAVEPLDRSVCRLIEAAAHANRLPVGFMTRVIWSESSFRAAAVSPAGAEGIAQFMPGTAAERGLADPFDPEQAIPKAAHLLRELQGRFGNLGLAAAAYNAGTARVALWLRGQGGLPAETRAYVRRVTERPVETWSQSGSGMPGSGMPGSDMPGSGMPHDAAAPAAAGESCVAVAAELRRSGGGGSEGAPLAPWGVQLAGNFSKALALAEFDRARQRYARAIGDREPMIIGRLLRSRGTRRFYQVRLPAGSRQAADALCRHIQAVGGACVAMRS